MKSVQIFLAIIILTAGIVGGFYYFQPVEEVTEDGLYAVEFQLTQDQYEAILNGIFFANEEGKIQPKADYAMNLILQLQERVKALETTVGLYAPAVDLSFEEPIE